MNSCKTKLASFKIIGGIIFLLFTMFYVQAQTRTTKEAKVIFVVSEKSDALSHLELYNTFQKMNGPEALEKYPNSQFYIGLLQGSYEVVQAMVRPQTGTTIIVFINQPLFGDSDMVITDYKSPGDLIKIGNIDAKVISNSKGELILKTQ